MGASAGLMLAGSGFLASTQMGAGRSQRQLADAQAQASDLQAQDAIERGAFAQRQTRLQTRAVIGAQRASLAAQGVDVNDGSAADVQASTASVGAVDAAQAQRNAQLEAWGFRTQAADTRSRGQIAEQSGMLNAGSTILGGASRAYAYSRGAR